MHIHDRYQYMLKKCDCTVTFCILSEYVLYQEYVGGIYW